MDAPTYAGCNMTNRLHKSEPTAETELRELLALLCPVAEAAVAFRAKHTGGRCGCQFCETHPDAEDLDEVLGVLNYFLTHASLVISECLTPPRSNDASEN
jgi:predicted deacylase